MKITEQKHELMWRRFLEQHTEEMDSMNMWSRHAFKLRLRVKFDLMLHDAGIITTWKNEL